MKKRNYILLIAYLLPISGCSTLATGGAEVTGLSLLHDRRNSETILLDERIELSLGAKIREQSDLYDKTHVNATSYNGIVMLTGEAQEEPLRNRVAELARTTAGVKKVHNFMDIDTPSSFSTRTNDTLISGKVKSAISTINHIPGFDATRIKVVTEKGIVYLMGLVHKNEANIATEMARREPGVRKVVMVFEYLE
ncbi:MAG: BON domain-containing protein [Gammaproteobacteria bacterium]